MIVLPRRCLLVVGVLLAGCTPATVVLLPPTDASDRAEIVVFREPAVGARGMQMVFGADGSDYVVLDDGEYARIYVQPSHYDFFVRSAQKDIPSRLALPVERQVTKCLRAYANPDNTLKALFPPAYYAGSTFLLEEVQCPATGDLERSYSFVPVDYQSGQD